MSLLNKVLRDLEQRRDKSGAVAEAVPGVMAVTAPARARRIWFVLAFALLVAGAGAALLTHRLPGFWHHISGAGDQRASALESAAKTATDRAVASHESKAGDPAMRADAHDGSVPAAPAVPDSLPSAQATVDTPEAALLRELRLAPEIETPIGNRREARNAAGDARVPVTTTENAAPAAAPPATESTEKVAASARARAKGLPGAEGNAATQTAAAERTRMPQAPAEIAVHARAPDARQRAHEAVEAGLLATSRKQYVEAQQAFRAALAQDPANDRGRQALLSVQLAMEDKLGAEATADEGILSAGVKVGFALVSARLKLERGAVKDAIDVLERERAAGARQADYQALWGNALSRAGRYGDAVQRYAAAVELAPGNPAHHVGLGYALRNDGQFASAQAVFQSVAEMPGLSPQLADLVQQQLASLQRLVVKR